MRVAEVAQGKTWASSDKNALSELRALEVVGPCKDPNIGVHFEIK